MISATRTALSCALLALPLLRGDAGAFSSAAELELAERASASGLILPSARPNPDFEGSWQSFTRGARERLLLIGPDNRHEYFEAPPDLRRLADSVAALQIIKPPPSPPSFKPLPLCPGARFSEQRRISFCTGFLVGADLLLTAGHCVGHSVCPNVRVVFGKAMRGPGDIQEESAPPDDTYYCREVLARSYTAKTREADYALLRLDRPVARREPLELDYAPFLPGEGTEILAIGHLMGLPVKLVDNASVRISTSVADESRGRWFVTSLDTAPGLSGGPVIAAGSRRVIGIFSRRGAQVESDYAVFPDCRMPNIYGEGLEWGAEATSVYAAMRRIAGFITASGEED